MSTSHLDQHEASQPSRKTRVAILGGSFNPITNAHLCCAAEIIHSKLADEVWITPCGCRPDKPSLQTPALSRLVMCHLAVDTTFGSNLGIQVCDEEMGVPRNIPSIVLMRRLKAKHPDRDFTFVIGSDLISSLPDWDAPGCPGHWEAVEDAGRCFMEECDFIVIDRPGHELHGLNGLGPDGKPLGANFAHIGLALRTSGKTLTGIHLPSAEVRHRIRDDFSRYGERSRHESKSWYDEAEGLIPASVLGHIVRYELFSRKDG